MPLYEYRCQKCGAVIEKIQKFSDAPLLKCEECGGRLEKLLSPPAIQFKGSGWYVTDYGRKSRSADGDSGSNHGHGASGESKKAKPEKTGDTAPAAKK